MNSSDSLDQQALQSAKQYMGALAWPTVMLGVAVGGSYIATLSLALSGALSLWVATLLMAALTYLSYTLLHEAAHGSISGSRQSMRGLNVALGYMAAWILMIPLTVHRHEHLAHHRHTNDADSDPDYQVGDIRNSPVNAVMSAAKIYAGQYSYYMSNRWDKAPAKQNLYFCLEMLAIVLPRLALLAAGY